MLKSNFKIMIFEKKKVVSCHIVVARSRLSNDGVWKFVASLGASGSRRGAFRVWTALAAAFCEVPATRRQRGAVSRCPIARHLTVECFNMPDSRGTVTCFAVERMGQKQTQGVPVESWPGPHSQHKSSCLLPVIPHAQASVNMLLLLLSLDVLVCKQGEGKRERRRRARGGPCLLPTPKEVWAMGLSSLENGEMQF